MIAPKERNGIHKLTFGTVKPLGPHQLVQMLMAGFLGLEYFLELNQIHRFFLCYKNRPRTNVCSAL
ncbi:hypothetical protein DFQ01_14511 [Paenibacillus cellulosilyticus]|uniref:Uncharacterized protein n=1 Tax=Paenibacillus cellulosilyticus TaxID=375489 RepID=A0A2V2YC79_9BACL|nr:hypothetical protein DFQ01_14511 [Paenibacillus cellulosilyticus]